MHELVNWPIILETLLRAEEAVGEAHLNALWALKRRSLKTSVRIAESCIFKLQLLRFLFPNLFFLVIAPILVLFTINDFLLSLCFLIFGHTIFILGFFFTLFFFHVN